jgi:hypothetical protein
MQGTLLLWPKRFHPYVPLHWSGETQIYHWPLPAHAMPVELRAVHVCLKSVSNESTLLQRL